MNTGTRYWVGLQQIPGIGAVRAERLVSYFGTVAAAWHASPDDLRTAGLPSYVVTALQEGRAKLNLDAEMQRLKQHNVQALTLDDDAYPRLLRHIPSPPIVLYVRGILSDEDELAIGVVGTRRSTGYGNDVARRFSGDLAAAGVTIVSGLARGIDTVAHRAALDAGGRTIAVCGCGLDQVYPPSNRQLAAQISEHGALVSEYPLGTNPDARNFPARNRIISGMSRGTLVVEAPSRSGALITADFAADHGRDVYAVPGSVFSIASAGCHDLIRNGATLVTSAAEILNSLNIATVPTQRQMRMLLPDTDEERILYTLLGAVPRHVDELCHDSSLPIHVVSGTLLAMELKGLVRQSGAQHYVRA